MKQLCFILSFGLLAVCNIFSQKDSLKITLGNISREDADKIAAARKMDVFIPSGDYNILLFKMGTEAGTKEVKENLEQEGKKIGKNFLVHTYLYDLMVPATAEDARKTGHQVFANMVVWMDGAKVLNYAEVQFKKDPRYEDGNFPFSKTSVADMVLAHYYYNSENYPKAIEYFKKLAACNEKNGSALYQLGCCYHVQGDTSNARKNYEKAVKAKPELAAAYSNLGLLYLGSENMEGALSCYENAVNAKPGDPALIETLASTYYQAEKWALAEKWYKKLLEITPGNTDVLNMLALSAYRQNNFDDACVWYEKLMQIDNNSEDAHFNYAYIKSQAGNYEQALKHYLETIKINPASAKAHLGAAYMYNETGKKKEAKEHYLRAIQLKPSLKNIELEKTLGITN